MRHSGKVTFNKCLVNLYVDLVYMGFKYNKQGMALNTSQFLNINKNKLLYKTSICKQVLNAKYLSRPKKST